jgi:hypothetical protein
LARGRDPPAALRAPRWHFADTRLDIPVVHDDQHGTVSASAAVRAHGQPWHVHFTESGTVADKSAAGAAMGLAIRLTELGPERFGVCQAPPCPGVFIDTASTGPGDTAPSAA